MDQKSEMDGRAILYIPDNGRMSPNTPVEIDSDGNQVGQVRFYEPDEKDLLSEHERESE